MKDTKRSVVDVVVGCAGASGGTDKERVACSSGCDAVSQSRGSRRRKRRVRNGGRQEAGANEAAESGKRDGGGLFILTAHAAKFNPFVSSGTGAINNNNNKSPTTAAATTGLKRRMAKLCA